MLATISVLSVANGQLKCSVARPGGPPPPPPLLFSVPCDSLSGPGIIAADVVRAAARRALAASATEGAAGDLVGQSLTVELPDPPAAPTLSLVGGILQGVVAPGTRRLVVRLPGLPDDLLTPNQAGQFSLHIGDAITAATVFAITEDGLRGPAATVGGGAPLGPVDRPASPPGNQAS